MALYIHNQKNNEKEENKIQKHTHTLQNYNYTT